MTFSLPRMSHSNTVTGMYYFINCFASIASENQLV